MLTYFWSVFPSWNLGKCIFSLSQTLYFKNFLGEHVPGPHKKAKKFPSPLWKLFWVRHCPPPLAQKPNYSGDIQMSLHLVLRIYRSMVMILRNWIKMRPMRQKTEEAWERKEKKGYLRFIKKIRETRQSSSNAKTFPLCAKWAGPRIVFLFKAQLKIKRAIPFDINRA